MSEKKKKNNFSSADSGPVSALIVNESLALQFYFVTFTINNNVKTFFLFLIFLKL